jgi:hypothetical protein
MAPGCPEKIDFEFAWWILSYRHRKRRSLLPRLRAWAAAPGRRLIVITAPHEVEALVESLPMPRRT